MCSKRKEEEVIQLSSTISLNQVVIYAVISADGSICVFAWNTILMTFFIFQAMLNHSGYFNPLRKPSFVYIHLYNRKNMSGKKAVDKVSKGLGSLIDEFASAVKEMVNAGEETVVHLAVGSSRVIKAAIDATGEVTKITVETAGNVVGSVAQSVKNVVGTSGQTKKEEE